MIIKAFSEHLKQFERTIPPVIILSRWLKDILEHVPENNVEKIIHTEICYLRNKIGIFILVGKSETGRNLLESLYNFALSFEQHNFSKWVHDVKASDFKQTE